MRVLYYERLVLPGPEAATSEDLARVHSIPDIEAVTEGRLDAPSP